MNANEILKKHEDANEMHFHEVDRKWIIQAMEEYAALRQPPVSGEVCDNCGNGKPSICDKCYEIESNFRECY